METVFPSFFEEPVLEVPCVCSPQGMKNELVRHLIHAINEATTVIPGWDDYTKTGVAKQLWDGVV